MQEKVPIKHLNVVTFNVRGLTDDARKSYLEKDMDKYKLDIICLQETKINKHLDIPLDHSRFINFKPNCVHYGLGFLVNKHIEQNILNMVSVSDRICYIEIELEEHRTMTVINVYGPTQAKVNSDTKHREESGETDFK